jgi:small subunit ribosomal protein S1
LKIDADKELALRVLIPASELSWEKSGEEALKDYAKGTEMKCIIQDVDVEKERIIASVKQLSEDAVMNFIKPMLSANSVSVRLIEVKKEGMMAQIIEDNNYNIPVIIERNEISRFKDEQNTEDFSKGEILQVKLLNFDRKDKVLTASLKALQKSDGGSSNKNSGDENTHFGEALGDALRQ